MATHGNSCVEVWREISNYLSTGDLLPSCARRREAHSKPCAALY